MPLNLSQCDNVFQVLEDFVPLTSYRGYAHGPAGGHSSPRHPRLCSYKISLKTLSRVVSCVVSCGQLWSVVVSLENISASIDNKSSKISAYQTRRSVL